MFCFFFFSSRRRHTRCSRDWSSDVCSSDLKAHPAAWMPNDGYAEPYTLATAYASAARRLGATFATGCDVLDIRVADGRARGVTTRQAGMVADVEAEAVVIAAGAWTRVILARARTAVPAFAVRHQAWGTAPMDWLAPTFPVVRVPDRLAYLRPEVGGLLLGFFETTPLGVDVAATLNPARAPGLM